MAGYVERGEVPGLVTLVARRGEVHVDAIGTTAAGGAGRPVERDTIFRIASMTKPVTAVATMILVEECRLRLGEPVDRLLPELADRRVLTRLDAPLDDTEPALRPITVRDLLAFTMGFGLAFGPPGTMPIADALVELRLGQGPPMPSVFPDPDEWLRRLGTLPLMHQPGERWRYNTGSDVLGVLIARAAGQPFDAFLRERIFEPLGMKDTGFSVPAESISRFATGYGTDFETGKVVVYDEPAGGQWSAPPAFASGAAGLVSTADDYGAFAQMLLNFGMHNGERIVSRPTVETMTTDQLTSEQKAATEWIDGFFDASGWGFGVLIATRRANLANVGSYGWDGGLGTSWLNDPREAMATILLTQQAWTSPTPPNVCNDFRTSAYQAIDD